MRSVPSGLEGSGRSPTRRMAVVVVVVRWTVVAVEEVLLELEQE
jgi:hypothetical protein